VSPRRINPKNQAPKTKEIPDTKIQLGPHETRHRWWIGGGRWECWAQSYELRGSFRRGQRRPSTGGPFWCLDLGASLVFGAWFLMFPQKSHPLLITPHSARQ